jgi:hypothetical protein
MKKSIIALFAVLVIGAAAPSGPTPVEEFLGPMVDDFRLENVWDCGSSVEECLEQESDALVLTRVAIGEAPNSPDDQIFIMWLIRLRAYLGFKHGGTAGDGTGWCGDHWCNPTDRWGSPTTIHQEALCIAGCQFAAVEATEGIYFPCLLSAAHPLRRMLCPLSSDLPEFWFIYQVAEQIVRAPITEFPEQLRGYDSFRSPTITWIGQHNRIGGLASTRFFRQGNIWRDQYDKDNAFWATIDESRAQ